MEAHRIRNDPDRSLVGFHVGDGYYAVEVPAVREIISPTHLVAVPHASPIVRGVTDHRGRVVPVVDLRKRFGLPAADITRRTKWVVVEESGQWLGLVVDNVTEVFGVNATHERLAPKLGPDEVTQGFSRVFVFENKLVLLLDLVTLCRAIENGAGPVQVPSWKPPAPAGPALGGRS